MPRRVATTPSKITGFSAPAGRPTSNVGKYILRPDPVENTGFTMLNTEPDMVAAAKEHYLSRWELPPALTPTRIRHPEATNTLKRRNISKGFNNPKSHQG